MKQSDVAAESHLKFSIHFEHISFASYAYLKYYLYMNKFEIKNLKRSNDKKQKRMSFFRSLIKSVEVGANGTQDYVVKKGSGKNKIASTRQ